MSVSSTHRRLGMSYGMEISRVASSQSREGGSIAVRKGNDTLIKIHRNKKPDDV